jgi:exosortase
MSRRHTWRTTDALLLGGLVVLAVLATRGIWMDVLSIAVRDEEQSHILLAIPIAAWLAWVRRDRLRAVRPRWSIMGPPVLGIGWAIASFGYASGVEFTLHAGALLIVLGAVLTVVGPNVLVRFLPAVLALMFLIPVPGRIRQSIALPLQEISAKVTEFGLDIVGVPVTRATNLLTINGQDVVVAEACNGMRMVAALGLIAFAYVFSVPMRNGVRLLILIASPLVAIIVNVVRLIPTALLYGYSTATTAETFHDWSWWLVLLLAVLILWLIVEALRWIEVPITPYALGEE